MPRVVDEHVGWFVSIMWFLTQSNKRINKSIRRTTTCSHSTCKKICFANVLFGQMKDSELKKGGQIWGLLRSFMWVYSDFILNMIWNICPRLDCIPVSLDPVCNGFQRHLLAFPSFCCEPKFCSVQQLHHLQIQPFLAYNIRSLKPLYPICL